jgi:hypothetical protein
MVWPGSSTHLWCGWDTVHLYGVARTGRMYGVAGIQYTSMVWLEYRAHLWCGWDPVHIYGVSGIQYTAMVWLG